MSFAVVMHGRTVGKQPAALARRAAADRGTMSADALAAAIEDLRGLPAAVNQAVNQALTPGADVAARAPELARAPDGVRCSPWRWKRR